MTKSTPEASFTLTLPALVAGIDEIAAIDAKLSETLGTIGKIMGEAKVATLAAPAPALDLSGLVAAEGETLTWEATLAAIDTLRTETVAAFEAAIVAEAGDTQVTHKATVEALAAERSAKYAILESMHTIMAQMPQVFVGIDKVKMPTATRSTSSKGASSSSGTPSAKGVSVYVVKDDGGRYFYAKGSPLALVGLRAFKASAEEFKAALAEAGVDVSGPFEPVKIDLNGVSKMVGGIKAEEAPAS